MAKSATRLGRGLGGLIAGGTGGTSAGFLDERAPEKNGGRVNGNGQAPRNGSSVSEATVTGIGDAGPALQPVGERLLEVALDSLCPNPRQPRKILDPVKVKELAASIRAEGLLQPVVVRQAEEQGLYEIIAGERRWRAHRELGRKTVLVRVVDATDLSSASLSLIENLQRENLNPIEEALGFASLLNDFNLTQAQVAERVGKSRTYVTNTLRLLQLDDELRMLLGGGGLSVGHAKVLLGVEDEELRANLGKQAAAEGWTVRECEQVLADLREDDSASPTASSRSQRSTAPSAAFSALAARVAERLDLKAKVIPAASGGGKLVLPFSDEQDLRRITTALGV